ncbi:hypothetical protein TEA_028205 [Camellia sinensis var. sinensis]|uniref:non-specific serine/threonine protein kinase n=1 Tax=Camellia sinensis var. sinensis TaxID=542762 RepID=A0A4V3WKL2_CAMSN|nr:hypothetical protein TEA_028205 [Camellia sinensis var. sinensis]
MGNCWNIRPKVDLVFISEAHSGPPKCLNQPPPILTIHSSTEKDRTAKLPSPILNIHSSNEKDRTVKLPSPRSTGEILPSPHVKALSFNELKNATINFRPESLLGEGGFGYVYKGWLDERTLTAARPGFGTIVAVKKLKPKGFQGHKEWLSEVNYLGQLHHPNLVKLIGYCLEGDNRLLVYEFMPRGSLENHLFKRSAKPLSWETRVKVATGAARGLSFLHGSESQVIYRDFKASNILLDSANPVFTPSLFNILEFNAKLSDFGLAKAGPTGDQTHVSTQVVGTHGYTAPEYVSTGAARGLSFLHGSESQVIYRDFKASNILLDSANPVFTPSLFNILEFNAKLSDFGLAKAGPTGDQTHVSTQVVGTHGYTAPEYVSTDGDDSEEEMRFCASEEESQQNRESEERETRI